MFKKHPSDGGTSTDKKTNQTDWQNAINFEGFNPMEFDWGLAERPDVGDEILTKLLGFVEFDTTKRVQKPRFRFDFNGHKVMPAGNIMAITGRQKNGKSQLLNILTAISLQASRKHSFGDSLTCGCIECISPAKTILLVDTEEGISDIQANTLRLFSLMGLYVTPMDETLPDSKKLGLHILPLRNYSPSQRVQITNSAIRLYDPDIVIVDGIRDFVRNINDQEEATDITTWCLQCAQDRDLWTVIHQNPTGESNKMRGALGTELMNKCSLTFQVSKAEKMFSVVIPEDGCRQDGGDTALMFRYVSDYDLQPVGIADVLRRCFAVAKNGLMKESDLVKRIKVVANVSETQAFQDFINPALTDGCLAYKWEAQPIITPDDVDDADRDEDEEAKSTKAKNKKKPKENIYRFVEKRGGAYE